MPPQVVDWACGPLAGLRGQLSFGGAGMGWGGRLPDPLRDTIKILPLVLSFRLTVPSLEVSFASADLESADIW